MYNHEKFKTLTEGQRYDVLDKIGYREDEELNRLVGLFRNGEIFGGASLLSAGKVRMVWNKYAELGHVMERHYRILDDMVDDTSYAIAHLWVVTLVCGHTTIDPDYQLKDEYEMDDKEIEAFVDWCNGFYISDYGFPELNNLHCELLAQDTYEGKLITIDRVLNVWHGSGPLADRFIEGGMTTLLELQFSTQPA
jgi:hypothetical protein